MKILVIEDEVLLADSLKALLTGNGFEVECVYNGEDGAAYAGTGIYDLLILDVMMPGRNGYEVARRVRKERCGVPILMLTAKTELEDEIEGLDAGADYYLTKPFDSRKLLACIHALLRRQGAQVNELVAGNTALNLLNATLSCKESSVRLSSKEFDVMRYLIDSNAVENNVEVYVGLLRKKLKYIGSDIEIQAIRRQGYLLDDSKKPK